MVGNRHCIAPENEQIKRKNATYTLKHKWTAFVKPENDKFSPNLDKLISKIRIGLHATFRNPYKDIAAEKGKPLEWTNIAYGWFETPITIYWTQASG